MTESDRIPTHFSRRTILRGSAAAAAGGAAAAALVSGSPAYASTATSPATGGEVAKLGNLQVFTNNVGYEANGPKRFVIGAGACSRYPTEA